LSSISALSSSARFSASLAAFCWNLRFAAWRSLSELRPSSLSRCRRRYWSSAIAESSAAGGDRRPVLRDLVAPLVEAQLEPALERRDLGAERAHLLDLGGDRLLLAGDLLGVAVEGAGSR
jgi:hypothetical protein